ncbi:lysozyme inhibitor LprI family protein [Hungatella effluvii]|uniref:lysozyme inhibitor LprI family protein n=1 Tax=Hungatella effluvii TaxID=1096246 RepID=UPI0022E61E7C|nr:lysozyme inhibitor LprI family protein [Hungatella effluvii]
MNKNRGIWLVIAAILIIGIAVTFATSRFIRQNGGSLDTVAVTQMPGTTAGGGMPQAYTEGAGTELPAAARKRMEETVPAEEEGAVSGNTDEAAARAAVPEPASSRMMAAEGAAVPAPESILMDENKEAADEAVPEAAAAGAGNKADAAAPSISPLGPGGSAVLQSDEEEKLAYYEKRLAELDAQVQKMRSESSDPTTYSMKTLAEKEFKLWNIEMNTIYAEIMNGLDEDAKGKLESEQQTWMKSRDTKAEEAARKYSGGSLEGVEYTASQAETTRTRTYDLVETYINSLPAENEG